MNPPSLLCLVRSLWYSLYCGAWVSGHQYRTSPEKTPPNVHVLVCETCGHVSVAWAWGSLEDSK